MSPARPGTAPGHIPLCLGGPGMAAGAIWICSNHLPRDGSAAAGGASLRGLPLPNMSNINPFIPGPLGDEDALGAAAAAGGGARLRTAGVGLGAQAGGAGAVDCSEGTLVTCGLLVGI